MTIQEAIECQEARIFEIKRWMIRDRHDRNALEVWQGRLEEAEQALVGMKMIK